MSGSKTDYEDSSEWDSDASDREPQPPVVTKNGWMLHGDVLKFKGHPRMESARLRLILAARSNTQPKSAEGIEAKAWIEGTNLQSFFHSQMAHYGLFKRYEMDIAAKYRTKDLEPKVVKALSEGLCENPPESILKLTKKLHRKNESALENYNIRLARWNARQNVQQNSAHAVGDGDHQESESDRQWRLLEDRPGERANLDLERFLAEYFLSGNRPDPRKTTDPLRLDGLKDRSQVILRVKAIPGLFVVVTSKAAGSVACIGFDWDKIMVLLQTIEAEAVQELNLRWMNNFSVHTALLHHLRGTPAWREPQLSDCAGAYMARWRRTADESSQAYSVSLHVSARYVAGGEALVAAFDFGVCTGTMYLSRNADVLQRLAEGECDADLDTDSDADSATDRGRSRKRKRASTGAHAGHLAKRPSRPELPHANHNAAPAAAAAGGLPRSLNLYATFRGRKTVDGESRIFHIPRSAKFTFWDVYYCMVNGEVDLPGLGWVGFEAFKMSQKLEADEEPRPWREFSETASKRERREIRREQEEAEKEEDEEPERERKSRGRRDKSRGRKRDKSHDSKGHKRRSHRSSSRK